MCGGEVGRVSDTSAVCITLTGSVSLRFTSTLLGLNPCIPLSTWIPWTPRIPWNPWFPWIPWIQRMHRTSGIHIVHGCAESMCSNDSMDSIVSCKMWNWVNLHTDFTLIHPPAPPPPSPPLPHTQIGNGLQLVLNLCLCMVAYAATPRMSLNQGSGSA